MLRLEADVTALAADPGKLEQRYVWIIERKVNGTSNVRWICMGCRVQATSGITRLRYHLTCVKKAGAQVRRYCEPCAFPPTETLSRTQQPCEFPIPGAKELLGPLSAAATERVVKLKEQKGDRDVSNAVLSLFNKARALAIQQTPRTTRPLHGLPSATCRSPPCARASVLLHARSRLCSATLLLRLCCATRTACIQPETPLVSVSVSYQIRYDTRAYGIVSAVSYLYRPAQIFLRRHLHFLHVSAYRVGPPARKQDFGRDSLFLKNSGGRSPGRALFLSAGSAAEGVRESAF